jgi:ParB family chromosome partitioning protein
MAKRKTLGKGLNALLPDIASVMEEEKRVMPANVCNIEDIRPNPYQPRKSFDSEKIEELAASLRANGVIQPLVVRERPDGYELIAGERRWRAASLAGLREVPIVIKDVPDHEVLRLSLIENIQRENLNPMEEAEAYLSLTKEFDLSQESLADLVGKDRSTITNALRLLKLPEKIKHDVTSGKISSGHARAILGIDTDAKKQKLHREVLKRELSVRQTEKLAKKMRKEGPLSPRRKEDVQVQHIREKLQRILGTQVKIIRKGEKGRIEITFFSDDDLERILEAIQGGKILT